MSPEEIDNIVDFEAYVQACFERVCIVLRYKNLSLRPMKRKGPVENTAGMCEGYADLQKCLITMDYYTPKRREPRSTNGLLRILAHEIAHFQKPPYRQRHKGRWIVRQHFPAFYKQVNKNVEKLKKDEYFSQFFRKK